MMLPANGRADRYAQRAKPNRPYYLSDDFMVLNIGSVPASGGRRSEFDDAMPMW